MGGASWTGPHFASIYGQKREVQEQSTCLSFLYVKLQGPEKMVDFKLLLSESENGDDKQMSYVYLQKSDPCQVSAGQR